MILDGKDLRRLRFDLEVERDESVPGTIARGVAGHHLIKLNVVLEEAGLGRYAGLTQLADPTKLTQLAFVLRCDPDHLGRQTGRRLIKPGERRLQHFVDFDGLIMPRSHLELRRRRISPIALLDSVHHRQAWLMSVLPFCPETLERLVDACSLCGSALGWVRTAGIERCENCLRIVPPSSLPPLADDLAEDYRLFAALLSLRASQRIGSVAAMARRLRGLSAGELARLAMRCGLDCGVGEEKRAWQTRAARLPAERIAEMVTRGTALLRNWPEGISAWAVDRLERATDENSCRRDMKRRIRRIAWGDSSFRDQRDLLNEVFPDLEPPSGRREPDTDTFYTGRQATRRLPGFRGHAAEIRRLGIVPHRVATDRGDSVAYLYSGPIIDAAAERMADATSISSIMDQLKLPLYAIEQFIEAGLLARHQDPLLALLLRRPMAIASTHNDFVRRLTDCRSTRRRPTSVLPIGHESRRIGGRAKPWSEIYQALLTRRIAFWPVGGIGTDRLMVARGSLDEFLVPSRDTGSLVGTVVPDMSTLDAAELLNLAPGEVRRLRSLGRLPETMGPRARTTPRADVERLAAKQVSAAEIARRTRTSAEHVNNQLRSLGFTSSQGLWRRSEVLDALPLR